VMSDIADQQEVNRLIAKIEVLELEFGRLRVALQKLTTFDYATDEKIAIAQNALGQFK